ncbi:hypothetical protein HDU81_006109 [Chytriomyces hyalinus]|nr:hypothetical protein HDU81_006109 [Chytriomyces hyalinus]
MTSNMALEMYLWYVTASNHSGGHERSNTDIIEELSRPLTLMEVDKSRRILVKMGLDIIIVASVTWTGGGMAGSTLALGLAQAGHTATIYERCVDTLCVFSGQLNGVPAMHLDSPLTPTLPHSLEHQTNTRIASHRREEVRISQGLLAMPDFGTNVTQYNTQRYKQATLEEVPSSSTPSATYIHAAATYLHRYSTPAGIMITANGLQVFKNFGVLDAVRRQGQCANRNVHMNRIDGTPITTFKVAEDDEYVCIMRPALHKILNEAASALGVRFVCGKRLESFTQTARSETEKASVTVQFADGTTATGDLFIAADGIRSKTRELLFPGSNDKPIYTGTRGFLGLTRLEDGDPWLTKSAISFYMNATHRTSVNIMSVGNNLISWNVADHQEEPVEVDSWVPYADFPREAKRLADLLESWNAPKDVAKIIGNAYRISPITIYDRKSIESWTVGRVTLIGDAAHGMPPHLGQGTSMALEDVGVLVELLRRFPAEPDRCLRTYETIRIPRTTKIAEQTRQMGASQYTKSNIQRFVGELGLKFFGWVVSTFDFRVYEYDYIGEVEKQLKIESNTAAAPAKWNKDGV